MIWGTLIILLVLRKSIGYPLQYPMNEVPHKIFHEILHYILHPQIVISSLLYVDHPQLKLCTQILRTGDCHWRLVATSLLRSLAGSLSSAKM